MKKLLLISALIVVTGTAFGQSLQKGNLVGMHVLTITLDPDVTMNQYMDFTVNKYFPEFEKQFRGVKIYSVKGIRGENENSFGVIYVFESEDTRDKYFKEEGGLNELGNSLFEKLQPLIDEGNKLGTWSSKYTDWLVQ